MTFFNRPALTLQQCGMVRAILLLLALATSFIWIQSYELWMAATTLILATLACIFNPSDQLLPRLTSRPVRVLLTLLAAYAVLVWIRAATSDILALSLLQGAFYTLPVIVALTLMTLPGTATTLLLRGGYILLAGLSLIAIGQVMLFDMPNNDRASWPLIDANHLAMVMNVGVLFGLGLSLSSSTRRPGLILFVLSVVGMLLTGSRGGLVAIVPALFLFAFLKPAAWPFSTRKTLTGITGLLMLAFVFMLVRVGESSALYTFRELITDPAGFMGSRPIMWAAVWDLITERPFFGYGPGTFAAVYPGVMTPAHLSGGYAAHNDFLQIWMEIGVFGAGLYIAIGACILWLTIRKTRTMTNPAQKIQMVTATAALMALMVQAQIEFMLGVLPLMMLSGILIGLWAQMLFQDDSTAVQTSRRLYWTGQMAGAMIVMVATLSVTQIYAEICLRRSDIKLRQGNVAGFAMQIDAAQRWSLNLHAFPYLRAANFQLTMLMSGSGDVRANPETVQMLIDETRARNPYLSAIWETQGRLDNLQGRDPVPAWTRGITIEPRNASLRLTLLKYYERLGRGDEARTLAQESLKQWDLRGPKQELAAALERYRHDDLKSP